MALAETSPISVVDHQPLLDAVEARLEDLFESERTTWACVDDTIAGGLASLREFVLNGGKRLRPRFVDLGYLASVDELEARLPDKLVDLAAAVELLHAFALIHDDVMDGSETRRHRPTVHASYRDAHQRLGWRGEARRTGEGLAILLGDLAFAYSIKLEEKQSIAVRSLMNTTRIELHMGQFLDMAAAAYADADHDRLLSITEYKTARYTVVRPLQLGCALNPASDADRLSDFFGQYGQNVGIAYQLCDDLLGVFGDPHLTGKPLFDDLLCAKETLLLRATRATPQAGSFAPLGRLGTESFDEGDAAEVAAFMADCGAVACVEGAIDELTEKAIDLVERAELRPDVARSLILMAEMAGRRTR